MCPRINLPEGIDVPIEYCCPLTLEIMEFPVRASDGITYEKKNILKYMQEHDNESPITEEKMKSELIENTDIKNKIKQFLNSFEIKPINVFVTDLDGKHYDIIINNNETIKTLKNKIMEKTGLQYDMIYLTHQGKLLTVDGSSLKNIGIDNNSTIYIKARLNGGLI